MKWIEPEEYYASIPQKRVAAGALFFDENNRVLLVETSYKGWSIPGGVADAEESPRDACVREVKEEIDIPVAAKDLILLSVAHITPSKKESWKGDSLQFVFDGGVLDKDMINNIALDNEEIINFAFIEKEKITTHLTKGICQRVLDALQVKYQGGDAYFDYDM